MRSRNQNRLYIVKRSTILNDDFINDSISYCACVIVRVSDDFYDDRNENRLVEIRLNSLTSVIYQDLSSFQVYIELFHFPFVCMRKTLELKNFC